jgi:bifunctional N-acetylglucosamine-1-phosphate-uridyltransferase/glucosamine-1-phosphate-acetyltransferase GlmU-like protein
MITNLKAEDQHQHANGKGWVSNDSSVADSCYIGPFAIAYGKSVLTDRVRVEDYGQAKNCKLSGDVIVRRVAWLEGVTAHTGTFEYNERTKAKSERLGANMPYEDTL